LIGILCLEGISKYHPNFHFGVSNLVLSIYWPN